MERLRECWLLNGGNIAIIACWRSFWSWFIHVDTFIVIPPAALDLQPPRSSMHCGDFTKFFNTLQSHCNWIRNMRILVSKSIRHKPSCPYPNSCSSAFDPKSYYHCYEHSYFGNEALFNLCTLSKLHPKFLRPDNTSSFIAARAVLMNIWAMIWESTRKSGRAAKQFRDCVQAK